MNKFYIGDIIFHNEDTTMIDIIIEFNSNKYFIQAANVFDFDLYDFTKKYIEQNYKLLANIFRVKL